METDALDLALKAVLSQMRDDKKLHLVAFYLRKFLVIEIDYEIQNK